MSIWTITRNMAAVLTLCAAAQGAAAQPVGSDSDFTVYYHDFSGSMSPVMIDLGSGAASSGPISYTLDLAKPGANQKTVFDFDAVTATTTVDFLVDFPLLHTAGLSPIPLHIEESGPLVSGRPMLPLSGNQTFHALLTGGGTVADGPLAGWEFSNLNDTNINVVNIRNESGSSSGNQTFDSSGGGVKVEGTVKPPTPPGGPVPPAQPTTGQGQLVVAPNPIPEPSTYLLLAVGLTGVGALARRKVGRTPRAEAPLESTSAFA